MPKLSDTMEEGRIVAWHKKVGDKVSAGEIIAEVETDKATLELESYFDGVLLHIAVKEGEPVPVGAMIAIIGEEGEDISALLTQTSEKTDKQTAEQPTEVAVEQKETPTQVTVTEEVIPEEDRRIKASPLARRLAKEKGIPLEAVKGSGPGGRIIKRDIEAYVAAMEKEVAVAAVNYQDIPITQMRKTIAKRLAQSKFTAPHYYLTIDIRMDKAVAFREQLNQIASVKISFNDIIVKACAIALKKHPIINASWLEDKIRIYHDVHIGVAVALEDGLVVPVIRNADKKGLEEIAKESQTLAEKARNKGLQPQDYEGATFTVSNLGMFGIESFTAIINPPNVCILAVGKIRDAVIVEEGNIKVAKQMRVTLSCDHRVVDGAEGAKFLQTLKSLLEEPMRMLL